MCRLEAVRPAKPGVEMVIEQPAQPSPICGATGRLFHAIFHASRIGRSSI